MDIKEFDNSQKKYKIGYTTGTFDLFHVGHLNLLERAKEQCEILIVGVSTDELVEEYKKRKPIIPFNERIGIIAALKCVDGVIPQTSMDKIDAWEKIHYDALFHGDDWKYTKLYNDIEKQLEKLGVPCIYFSYTNNISSKKIRKQIENGKDYL